MTVIGATNYVYLGAYECGDALVWTHGPSGIGGHGLGNADEDEIGFFQVWMEHKQITTFGLQVRLFYPPDNFSHNGLNAITQATHFGINLDTGPLTGITYSRSATVANYGPDRWHNIEMSNTFGSVEWSWAISCSGSLPDPSGHVPYSTIPKIRTRANSGGGGGWSVGQA